MSKIGSMAQVLKDLYPSGGSTAMVEKAKREIQESEDAEFLKAIDFSIASAEERNAEFRFQSRCQFMSPDERTIAIAERQLMRADPSLLQTVKKNLAKLKLAEAMARPIRDRLREASFSRKIMPPQQITKADGLSVNHDTLVKIEEVP